MVAPAVHRPLQQPHEKAQVQVHLHGRQRWGGGLGEEVTAILLSDPWAM